MSSVFNIDGLIYADKHPHSRLEKLVYDLMQSGGGGGGGDGEIVVNYNIGEGLKTDGNRLSVDATDEATEDNKKPITSNGVFEQLATVNDVLELI